MTAVKKCTKCGVVKSLDDFHKRKATRDKRTSRCKPCINSAHAKWLNANKDKVAAYQRLYDAERAEQKREYGKQNPEKRRQAVARYRHRHPDRAIATVLVRDLRLRQAQPAWADIDAMRTVYWRARTWKMHVDHIVPIRHRLVCGLHVHANLQLLSPLENLRKKNRHWPDMP